MIEKRYAISCSKCGHAVCGELIGGAWQKSHRELRDKVAALGWKLGEVATCPNCIESTQPEPPRSSFPSLPPGSTHIRWMIRRDMPEVLAIEADRFEFPWSEEDFIRCLRQRYRIGMVAERGDRIAGFMVYELHKTRLHALNFAVARWANRTGVGRAMLDKLIAKMSGERRNRILLEVRESNLDAQLFFRSQGFRCISVLADFYEDTDEDAYLMQWSLPLDDRLPESAVEACPV